MKRTSGADRNSLCPKCGKKLKDCRGHVSRRKIALSLAGVGVIVLAGMFALREDKETGSTRQGRIAPVATENKARVFRATDSYGVTLENFTHEDSQALYRAVIGPAMTYIANDFPITSIREEFAAAVDNYGEGRKYDWSFSRSESKTWMFVRAKEGRPLLALNMMLWARFIRFLEQTDDPEFAREQLENQLIQVFLHENCHVTRQDFWKRDTLSQEEFNRNEAECHGYSTDIARVLIREGRNVQAGYKRDNEFYDSVGRNWRDLAWIRYIANRE